MIAIAVLIFFSLIASAAGIQLFNASRYRDLITVTEGDFASDVAELGMSQSRSLIRIPPPGSEAKSSVR